jgi:tRNA pseudouridine55 synthase
MRRRGDKVDGWVVLDKPSGLTSTQCVGRVRRVFNAGKVGHAGTLDPLATGVLIIALGEATKLVSHVMDRPKRYAFTVRWGEARDTDDGEGQVTATSAVRPDRAAIESALPQFLGRIAQRPPSYSALKLGGERAYDRARAGEVFELAERPVDVSRFVLIDQPDPDHARFELECGKGTYVRSLARDLAVALGTVGHVSALRRLAIGAYSVESAIALAKLEELAHKPAASDWLRPVATALDDIPALALTADQAARIARGMAVPLAEVRRSDANPLPAAGVAAVFDADRLVAVATVDGPLIRPLRVFNL